MQHLDRMNRSEQGVVTPDGPYTKTFREASMSNHSTKRQINLLGNRYGMLVVIDFARTRWGTPAWLCRCDCGNTSVVDSRRLRIGITKSCGCQQTVRIRQWIKSGGSRKHGCRHTRAYKCWSSMKERCLHPWHKSYANYGGAGVTICERWLNSFENFLADMGQPPKGYTIDRIDTRGNYEPGNCRWATNKEQQRNKTNNRLLTAFGETKPAVVWLEDPRCAANRTALYKRLENGWDHERAITQPLLANRRRRQ